MMWGFARAIAQMEPLCASCLHERYRDGPGQVGRYCARDGQSVATAARWERCREEELYEDRAEGWRPRW